MRPARKAAQAPQLHVGRLDTLRIHLHFVEHKLRQGKTMYATKNHLSLLAIVFYRKFISPYKNYHCAYSTAGFGLSCSTYAMRVFSRWPLFMALALQHRQFKRCAASRHYQKGEAHPCCIGAYACSGPMGHDRPPKSRNKDDWETG